MHFAENLKQLRKDRGLSQEALAELLDVSRQAVSKWEQGEGYPEVEKLLYLAQTLNISLDALMSTGLSAAPTCPVTTCGQWLLSWAVQASSAQSKGLLRPCVLSQGPAGCVQCHSCSMAPGPRHTLPPEIMASALAVPCLLPSP